MKKKYTGKKTLLSQIIRNANKVMKKKISIQVIRFPTFHLFSKRKMLVIK